MRDLTPAEELELVLMDLCDDEDFGPSDVAVLSCEMTEEEELAALADLLEGF